MDEDTGHRLDDRRGRRLGGGLGRRGGGGRGERRNGRSVVASAAGEGPPRQTRPAPIVGKWVEIGLRSRPERRRFGADRTDRGGARQIQTGVPAFGRAEGGAARTSEQRGRREELCLWRRGEPDPAAGLVRAQRGHRCQAHLARSTLSEGSHRLPVVDANPAPRAGVVDVVLVVIDEQYCAVLQLYPQPSKHFLNIFMNVNYL